MSLSKSFFAILLMAGAVASAQQQPLRSAAPRRHNRLRRFRGYCRPTSP